MVAISPLDDRYETAVSGLASVVGSRALLRKRVRVELDWVFFLASCPGVVELGEFNPSARKQLVDWADSLGEPEERRFELLEDKTSHDAKAVELLVREELVRRNELGAAAFVHFGITSDDINNIAYSLIFRDAIEQQWCPAAKRLIDSVAAVASAHRSTAMLGMTHGQPATPTTFGKELSVFVARWRRQMVQVESHTYLAKLNGATGTLGALVFAYPDLDWASLSRRFVESYGFTWNSTTTQVEPRDSLAELLQMVSRFNNISVDFSIDIWLYASRRLVAFRSGPSEVGSSTMPHKSNPIWFENAEGNAALSTSLLLHLAVELTRSRQQRDLADSTALRNVRVALAHSFLAIDSLCHGVQRMEPQPDRFASELKEEWQVLLEAVQTVLRRTGRLEAFELVRGRFNASRFGPNQYRDLVLSLNLGPASTTRLLGLSPQTYLGIAADMSDMALGTCIEEPRGPRQPSEAQAEYGIAEVPQ